MSDTRDTRESGLSEAHSPTELLEGHDAYVSFGAVADYDDKAALDEAMGLLHDRVVEALGDRRISGVEWAVYDGAEARRLLGIAGIRPSHAEAVGLLAYLDANPKGALVIAKAEYQ